MRGGEEGRRWRGGGEGRGGGGLHMYVRTKDN